MKQLPVLKKLNQHGFDHLFIGVGVVVIFGVIGTALLVYSHAASWTGEVQLGFDKNLCLDNLDGSKAVGNTIDVYECNATAAQKWSITEVGGYTDRFTLENGQGTCAYNTSTVYDGKTYYVGTNSSNRVYVKTASCSASKTYDLWEWEGSVLENIGSGGCINNPANSKTSGTNQIIYSCSGKPSNELWYEAAQKAVIGSTTSGSVPIQAGDSKASCIYVGGAINNLQATESTTGITYNCLETFDTGVDNWSDWEKPSYAGFQKWVAASPTTRQLILSMDLIPMSEENSSDPLVWEQACDQGQFNSYATTLAQNLVSTGLQRSVIRLGVEMNGTWETDSMGTTTQEMQSWASCFGKEVSAMRAVSGASFLFDWNPNSCYMNEPFADFYPGNQYVNIIGLDQYDSFCTSNPPKTDSAATFNQMEAEPDGLNIVEAFAKAQGKPMSIPEWGTVTASTGGLGDDQYYVQGIGSFVQSNDVAFQSYFDPNDDGIIPLSSSYPQTLAAYKKEFSN